MAPRQFFALCLLCAVASAEVEVSASFRGSDTEKKQLTSGTALHRSLKKGVAPESAADDTERLPKAPSSKAANSTKREEEKGCACQATNGYCYAYECNGWCQDYACGCYSGYPCAGDDGMCYAYDCGWYCSTSWCLNSALSPASSSSVAPETAVLESSVATPEEAQGAKQDRSLKKGVAPESAADDTERLPKAPSSKAANSTKREEEKGCACQGTNGYCYAYECNGWCQDYACGCYSGYPCAGNDGMCYAYDCGWYCSTSWCLNSALSLASSSSVAPETAVLESSVATPEEAQDTAAAAGRLRGTSAGF